MLITLNRFREDAYGTIGEMRLPDGKYCYILERAKDGPHPRIPAGTYNLGLKPIGASRFDNGSKKADDIGKWMGAAHRGMIQALDVPGRTEILIHPANRTMELLGCLAPGMAFELSNVGSGNADLTFWLDQSRNAYRLIYSPIADAILGAGAQIVITENFITAPLVA